MTKLTPAQVRAMQVISVTGHAPSNTTMALLLRLSSKGLIRRAGMTPITRMGNWSLTEAGSTALKHAEINAACRNLSTRLDSLA
jgi:hypothetical protein